MKGSSGRRAVRPMANHKAFAEALRAKPGRWRRVGTYRASYSADSIARSIRKGGHGYTPAGAFETRWEPVDDETGLYVRYVGAAEVTA